MRQLAYVCAQPTDKYFVWQVALWLQSLQDIGEEDKAHVVLFNPKGREVTKQWEELAKLYPKATFATYEDDGTVAPLLRTYIPILRPYVLGKYFKDHPELADKAVLYCDCDVLFIRKLDVDNYLDDEVCYLSDTISYVGSDYLIGKKRDVLPRMKEQFEKKDVVADLARITGIDRQVIIDNNFNSGGAQYLLKGVDSAFWEKVMKDAIYIKIHLDNVNKTYFENGNKGYQAWCADMWAVLYNLWHRGKQTRVVPEMDFSWSSDRIDRLEKTALLHNAGITSESSLKTRARDANGNQITVSASAFYKGKFLDGTNPYSKADYLEEVATNPDSKLFCTSYYASYMLKHKDKLWTVVSI